MNKEKSKFMLDVESLRKSCTPYNQTEFVAKCKISIATYHRHKTQQTIPSHSVLEKLSLVLGDEFDDLMEKYNLFRPKQNPIEPPEEKDDALSTSKILLDRLTSKSKGEDTPLLNNLADTLTAEEHSTIVDVVGGLYTLLKKGVIKNWSLEG